MSLFKLFFNLFKLLYLGGDFLIYNLDLFGKELRKMRKKLNLTQKEISELVYLDVVTLRRMEKGKVIPKLDTLEILSPIFKHDLIDLLLKYRFDDYSVFYEIKNRIELKLDGGEFNTLHSELKGLNHLLFTTNNLYYKNLITQLILLSEAIILYKDKHNEDVLFKLIKGIRITTPKFCLNNYYSFIYSLIEIRMLMNIALVLNKLNHNKIYIEIMRFCINSVDSNNEIYSKICHNLSGTYMRNNNFKKALEYSNKGIKSCQENRNLNGLHLLYYGKGVSEYKLDKREYIESLNISITLCTAFGQEQLKDKIINNCKDVFGINL